jgi:hypothetical protein
MPIKTHKTLQMTLDDKEVHCALTRCALVDDPTTEELSTFCGVESSSIAHYSLEIGGLQDWGYTDAGSVGPPAVEAYDAVCDILHSAYTAVDGQGNQDVQAIACVVTVGSATRSFDAKPTADVPFGGDSGAALTFDATLDVVSPVVDGP